MRWWRREGAPIVTKLSSAAPPLLATLGLWKLCIHLGLERVLVLVRHVVQRLQACRFLSLPAQILLDRARRHPKEGGLRVGHYGQVRRLEVV